MNIHAVILNPRAVIGDNHPPAPPEPTLIDRARDAYALLAAFLKNAPVITNAEEAKQAANFIEQARRTLGEIEDERKAQTKPLNDEVDAINEQYRAPRESIKKIMDELKRRLTAFAALEEERRAHEAEQKRLAAEEAERIARQAEAIEREAKEDANCGVVGVTVATAMSRADKAFDAFKRADREAVRAERQIPVRLNGGYGRAVSMRKTETLVISDHAAAIAAMGLTGKIVDAVLSSARDFRKANGVLPAGVSAVTARQF